MSGESDSNMSTESSDDANANHPTSVSSDKEARADDIKNANQIDDNMNVFDRHALIKEGRYMMEFRAVIDDGFIMPEDGMLMMYLHSENAAYPMHYNSKLKVYQLCLERCNANFISHIYKFFILIEKSNEKIWEEVPSCNRVSIWNRKCYVSNEQQSLGHAVVFDAIFFEKEIEKEYDKLFQINLIKLIPHLDALLSNNNSASANNATDFQVVVNFYEQWVDACFTAKRFQNESGNALPSDGIRGGEETLAQNWNLETGQNDAEQVLRNLCLFLAIRKRNNYLDLKLSLRISFCLGMSLEGLDDAQFALFLNQFYAIIKHYDLSKQASKTSSETRLKAMFRQLEEVPQYILVLPLLKLAQEDDAKKATTISPSTSLWLAFRNRVRRSDEHQKRLLQIKERIFKLSERFSWIRKLYIEAVNLNSVAQLLNSDLKTCVFSNAILPKLVYFWKQLNISSSTENRNEDIFISLCSFILEDLKTNIQGICENKDVDDQSDNFLAIRLSACLNMAKEMKHYVSTYKDVSLRFLVYTFDLCDKTIEYAHVVYEKAHAKSISSNVKNLQSELLNVGTSLAIRNISISNKSKNIAAWNCLSKTEWSDGEFNKMWLDTIHAAVADKINIIFRNEKDLIEYYCDELDKHDPTKLVSEWFTEVVINEFINLVISKELKHLVRRSFDRIKTTLPGTFHTKIGTLCIKILKKQWKNCPKFEEDNGENFFRFVQNWDILFLQTIYENKLTGQLPPELHKEIESIEDSVFKVLADLQCGLITVACLQKLTEIRKEFFDCLDMIQTKIRSSSVDHPFTRDSFYDLIAMRYEEMKRFFETKTALENFTMFFQSVTRGKLNFFCDDLHLDQDVAGVPLRRLVTCRDYKPNGENRAAGVRVIYFPLQSEDLSLIMKLQQNNVLPLHSKVIRQRMTAAVEAAQANEVQQLSFNEVVESLWKPLQLEIVDLVNRIDDGQISLNDIDDIFCGSEKKTCDRNSLSKELTSLYGVASTLRLSKEKKDIHLHRLESYFRLKGNFVGAQLLEETRNLLGLHGDFSILTKLLGVNTTTGDLQLSAMDEQILEINETLQIVTEEKHHLQTLEVFVECRALVEWLTEHIKDSKEVKVMIDLAMIAAGEAPMEIDRVSSFNSAVLGFSPLIFNTQPDSGLDDLLDACKQVWANVNNDPSILDQWEEAGKQLGWLEFVAAFEGSVEKSSLEKAQMINAKGLYQIKCGKDVTPIVENSIRLFLLEENKEIPMSLNDLRDLQSRLMLIAGETAKGKEDVTKFMTILSSVENLAKTYVKLKTSGCSLFCDWSANVRCQNAGRGNVTVEVYFDEKCQAISSSDDIVDELVNLTAVLDDAYCQWMAYLVMNRNKHYHLNHFNIQQLTFLCKELACSRSADYKDQVYQLLASILPLVDRENIIDCIYEATRVDDDDQLERISVREDEENLSVNDKKKNMVKKLMRLEVSEKTAKAAVQSVGFDDVEECLIWALTNGSDCEELAQQFDNDIGFESNQSSIRVIHNIVNDRSPLTLKQVISQLQSDVYCDTATMATIVKTICERYFTGTSITSLEDCLSLEHCGKFLECLGNRTNAATLPQREWPGHFISGKPNLLICRQPQDILLVLLSLYTHSPDQAMPSASEVLLCSEHTSAEEVELLFRRAIEKQIDSGQRIYCLAHADLLPFNVSKKAEECFDALMQINDKDENFKLVILTCSHQHYLTSCFYENKIEGYIRAKNDDIKGYLELHLSKKTHGSPAAKVDKNGSSVMVVRAKASGMGKSLYVARCREKVLSSRFSTGVCNSSTIRLLEKEVDVDDVITTLTDRGKKRNFSNADPHFVHIDITPSAQFGKSKLFFELVILGLIESSRGVIWRHAPSHLYMMEYTDAEDQVDVEFASFFNLLPSVTCLSPVEVQESLQQNPRQTKPDDEIHMDAALLRSEMYQRPFQYLRLYSASEDMDNFTYTASDEDPLECLNTLLGYCSVSSPSWSELSHFSKFLNSQLTNCEQSVFCDVQAVGADSGFDGFKQFVVQFMIRMSQDFATPSLNVEKNDEDDHRNQNVNLLELHQLRRRWESGFHPYVFFNDDIHSMSFANFNVNDQGALCHPETKEEVENLMRPSLVAALKRNLVNLQQNIDEMSREDKLAILDQVFGVATVLDPDPTYELTTDNVVKMLAIQMRFRCGIPVVIMGETGCGKTRMIDFMSKLKAEGKENVKNMVVVKVHGGVTAAMVQEKVEIAIDLAKKNKAKNNLETILFFDEANTTEAVYAIKEIMCDETVRGKSFAGTGLKIVAACNPYRAHSDEVIETMEKSGLGFHVKPENVSDTFDGKPMRHLVYRVISLPPSMHPLVWDFGQLNNKTEGVYIKQMVLKLQADINNAEDLPPLIDNTVNTISQVVTASQAYMRGQSDVCRFVSLRDAERTIQSFKWFYEHLILLNPMIENQKQNDDFHRTNVAYGIRALILAVSICYYVTLDKRADYREMIAQEISNCEEQDVSDRDILEEIIACQNVFINAIKLEKNIACNEALRENVFMMVMCAEMRIPLFLVGKPGSSKSLAKTIVTDAMQGKSSKNDLYRQLKEIHVLSFQCSAATDAVGIEAVFSQCAQLQRKNKDCSKYVATVVLDEIGLAEDSRKMPLKVLHPLLEATSTSDSLDVDPFQKVGFVGISNWALDPAKMNRGIFVTRGKPSQDDLHKTAEAIFESDEVKLLNASKCIRAVTDAYLDIYNDQEREFFGLRDYYAMMKMLYASSKEKQDLTFSEIGRAVIRNFSGTSDDVLSCFHKHCKTLFDNVQTFHIPVTELICNNLNPRFESRFLMLLTKQYSAVNLLSEVLGNRNYVVIFGSSFPHDHDYTEVCRNINKIKVCMETGRTVVLLNLRDLYESLYDALNQHYVTLAGQRYVDLGLGGHRVKCRIAPDFRLVVIEEKEIVHEKYPIPLINRLEKHVFEMGSILVGNQITTVKRLQDWVNGCCKMNFSNYRRKEFSVRDTFVGYNDDSCASALLSVKDKSFEAAQRVLLQTASLDGVCRFPRSNAQDDVDMLLETYMNHQIHDSLWIFLQEELKLNRISITEILSFSQVLNERDKQNLRNNLNLHSRNLMLLTLQQFQTEQQFSERIDDFLEFVDEQSMNHSSDESPHFVLLVQCSQAHLNGSLIACAKYSVINKLQRFKQEHFDFDGSFAACFLLTLERQATVGQSSESFANFYCGDCKTIYIDELKPNSKPIAPVSKLWDLTIQDVLEDAVNIMDGETDLIDAKKLIRESIPIAMAKLQNRVTNLNKNRIQLLLSMCFECSHLRPFFNILLTKIQSLIEDRRKKLPGKDTWIIEQACSSHSLQEGGTFRNVLWLWLRNIFASAIAKIVSVADADNNLDLLVKCIEATPKMAELWFETFDQNDYWDLQWTSIKVNESNSTFYVEGKVGFSCTYPFVRLIYDVLLKEWSLMRETSANDQHRNFLQKVSASPMLRLLNAAEESGTNALERFVNDLVHLMYKPRSLFGDSSVEFEIVKTYILSLHRAQRTTPGSYRNNALLELFILLIDNTKSMQTFAKVVNVHPQVVKERDTWTCDKSQATTFRLHHLAFASLIKQLDKVAKESFGPVDACHQWKSWVVQTKQVADKLLPFADDTVQKMWQRIIFVEMFLDELLPIAVPPEKVKQYLKPLALHARLLWTGAVAIKDLSKLRFLKIVVNTLKKCAKEIYLRLLCNWKDINCKACKRDMLIDPVMLPCRHYFCQRCVTQNPANKCPYCRYDITQTDVLQPMKLTSSQENELKTFKLACASFFLEYLSNVCFPQVGGRGQHMNWVDEDMFLALEGLVVNDKRTKAISPVQVEMDLNPTARSYILRLLLRCDERLAEEQLERHFHRMEEVLNDRTVLIGLYIKCKEDILLQQSLANEEHTSDHANIVFAYHQLQNSVCSIRNTDSLNQIEHLGTCAVLQFVAKTAASCVMQTEEQGTSDDQLQKTSTFFRALHRLCGGPEFLILRQFIIKCLCRRYGTDSISVMLENDMFRKLVPENLLPQTDEEKEIYYLADKLSLSGETYLKTKTLLLDIAQESDEERVVQQIFSDGNLSRDETLQIILAVSMWTAYDRENESRRRIFQAVLQRLNLNVGLQFCGDIAQGRVSALKCSSATAKFQYGLTELLIQFGIAVSTTQDGLLRFFGQIVQNPGSMQNMYLPTMPGTDISSVQGGVAGLRAYLCPNGHQYYIGECGLPMQRAVCQECGAPIGGEDHTLSAGNRAGVVDEQSQAGYKVRSPNASVVPERNLSKLSVCATRICLHLAMILGSRNGDGVVRMINRARGQESDFLFQQIQHDLKQLSTCIGRSVDDAFILMHHVLNRLRVSQNPPQQNCDWNSMNGRGAWEDAFQRSFLAPIFSNTAALVNQAQDVMINAGKLTEKPLERLVYELKKDDPLPDGIVPWNCPNLWKYMLHIDIHHLRQYLEGIEAEAKAEGAALKMIINSENLEMVRDLHLVVTLQAVFIKKYRQRIDMLNADNTTIEEFLEEENFVCEGDVDTYIQVWNKVKNFPLNIKRYNAPLYILDEEMSRDSPISMCLPSRRGRGLCALLLAEYLIDQQNNLLALCRELVKPTPSFETVDVRDVDASDLINLSFMEDVMPLVLENSQYETTVTDSGLQHNITYNLALLQKKVLQKFIFGKRIINRETIPLMKYPQDMGLTSDFEEVQKEEKQVHLPLKICQDVDDATEKALTANVCEVVRTLALVIQFLAKDKAVNHERRISNYAEQELLLPAEETEMIPRSAEICHCLALYERLSWHRSKRLIQNGQNPYENVVENAEDIPDSLRKTLKQELTKMNINRLQLELNALLMVGPVMENVEWRKVLPSRPHGFKQALTNAVLFLKHYSLRDILQPYVDGKYEDADTKWCEQIPEEILYKHSVHVFHLSMEYATK